MSRIIDSHCHLDGFVKDGTLADVLLRASEADVQRFVAIGTSSEDWQVNADLARKFAQIDYTIGLHPLNVFNGDKLNFKRFFEDNNTPCAIGEIGLDYHYLPDNSDREKIIEEQKNIFREQLGFAKSHDLPVAIHSRDAFDDTFEILMDSGISGDKALFHCFGYSPREMMILRDFGAYASFSGNVTYKNAAPIREALKIADVSKVLLETDCPYLSPVPFRGRPSEPSYIKKTAEFVSEFLQDKNFLDQAFENTVRFFGLSL